MAGLVLVVNWCVYIKMIRSKEVQEVLQLIDNEPRQLVSKENIFENPVRIYLVIKSLYQNYKRKNVLELMQERIFDLRLPVPSTERHSLAPVSAGTLFQYHLLSMDDLLLLIDMKEHLKEDSKAELYGEILSGIDRLNNVKEVMRCYLALLTLEYANRKRDMYCVIEERMVQKLIGMPLQNKDFRLLSRYLAGLPVIKQPILVLISHLYEKVTDLADFTDLFCIFQNNFPALPNRTDLQALVRINLEETAVRITALVQSGGALGSLILELAEREAKKKLETMPLVLTGKTQAMLNFIIQVVRFGRPIWHEIIEWEHRAAQEPKNFLKDKLEGILVSMLQDNQYFDTILGIIQKITEIDQHSQIGLIFVRELLRLEGRQYLSHRIIRRFLAIKVLKYNSSEEYVKLVFGKGTRFVDVILEMFNFDLSLVLSFYNNLRSEYSHLLDIYFRELAEKMPTKFKEFYLKCNSIDRNDPATIFLFKLLGDCASFEIAVSLTRDLALLCPSKHVLSIFTRFLSAYKENKQFPVLKSQVVRALNLMLVRTPKEQINQTIKLTLPVLIKDYLMSESQLIFENVPEDTKQNLKKVYDDFRKKM